MREPCSLRAARAAPAWRRSRRARAAAPGAIRSRARPRRSTAGAGSPATSSTHHMGGDELGVQIDCARAGPRIKRWRSDKAGNRQEDAHGLTPGRVRHDLEARSTAPAGRTCTTARNGTGGKHDPIYMFDIKDDQNQASFQCQSQSMPYPYNDIVDPLDLAAQQGRHQLGDDEPAEIKALDQQGQAAMSSTRGPVTGPLAGDRRRHRRQPRHRPSDRAAARRGRRRGRAVGARRRRAAARRRRDRRARRRARARSSCDVTDSAAVDQRRRARAARRCRR